MLDVRLDEHNYYSLELKLAAELARQYVTSLNQWAGINLSNENQCTYTCRVSIFNQLTERKILRSCCLHKERIKDVPRIAPVLSRPFMVDCNLAHAL